MEQYNTIQVDLESFRGNIYIDEPEAYDEDGYREVTLDGIGGSGRTAHFTGFCQRCNAITVNNDKEVRNFDKEPFSTLLLYRKDKATKKPLLGVFIHIDNPTNEPSQEFKVGDSIKVTKYDTSDTRGIELLPSELLTHPATASMAS